MWGCFCQGGEKSKRTGDGRLGKAAGKMGQSLTRKTCEQLCVCVHTKLNGVAEEDETCAVTREAKWGRTSLRRSDCKCCKLIGIDVFFSLSFCCCIGFGVAASCICGFGKNPSHCNLAVKTLIEGTSGALVIAFPPN